ncbi:Ig-like domain-containing protein [Pseudomonas batumici]|uniref:Ig-like domain-containing protein n=1 Tax=Pseudomonas batumici TaxID=226910 RepID=UPI0030CDDAEA
MNEDPSLPTSDVTDPLVAPRQPDFSFERDPQPERRPFNDLVIEVYGQRPVIGADIGVNKAALDTYYPDGLLCYLNPYFFQEEGDFVELFCGNADDPVAFTSVSQEEADKGAKIPLFIPRARLPEGVIQPVFFRLTRHNGGNQDETLHKSLLVDTIPPAGPYDPIPSTPWHEGLAPPEPPQFVIDFGVDKDTAEHGVPITIKPYPLDESAPHSWRMAEYDKIRLFIGGVLVTPVHSVTWDEANNRLPLTITIYYETWMKVGDGQKVLEYEVIDQCGNYSVKWSPQVVLKVNIGNDSRPRLPYAYIEESAEFGAEFDTVDYDLIGEDDDATIVITTIRQGYLSGDSVHVTLEGRTEEGATIRETIDYPIQDADTRRNIELPLRNEILRELVGGTAVLSYERIRAGSDPQPSEVTRLVILGSILSRLAKPQVLEAVGDFLDPTSLLATVEISPYVGQQPNDRVDLYLLGTRANEDLEFWHFFKMAGSTNAPVLFHLQHDRDLDIAGLNGGKLELHYVVTNTEGDRESLHTLLNVGEATATLPEPNVPEAPGGVLDPESSIRGATVVVPRAANLQEGDLLSVYWQGSKPGGSFTYRKFEVTSAWLNSDIPFPIERQYIDANKDGSVKAFYIVERGREPVRYSHVYHIKVGVELALEKPEVLETTEPGGNQLNPITAQTAVTIRVRYEGMSNSDNIQPYWKGVADIGSPLIEPKPGNAAQGYVDFTLSGDTAVGPNIGKEVEVSYEVTHGGATQPSDELNLWVQEIPQASLPRPEFYADNVLVTGSTLDVTKTIKMRVPSWPLIAAGQKVWLRLAGLPQSHTLWEAAPVSPTWISTGYAEIPVPASYLNGLSHNTTLSATFKVTFDHSSIEANTTTFPDRVVVVQNQPTLIIDTSPMILNGRAVIVDFNWPRTGTDYPGNTSTRTPTSGTPPYTYTSSNSNVASVAAGKVTGQRNGSATITVRDQSGQFKTYNVQVSNVKKLLVTYTLMTYTNYQAWVSSMGGIDLSDYSYQMLLYYRTPLPQIHITVDRYWVATGVGCSHPDARTAYLFNNANPITRCYDLKSLCGGFCLIDR